jgi:2-keto-3-deoxy-L-rhamnonate aldolase RhmA
MSVAVRDLLRNNVKEKLARDEVVASMTVRLVRGIEIARIAKTAGFDSLYVDVEHSSFSLDTTGQICIAALAIGIAPFVRVPSTRPEHVSRALDAGALGVIAPHIRSAAQAREVVAAAKFPPLGERSAAGALPHLHYRSFPAAEANAAMNAATMVIVQFETADALEEADAIAAVEGVDLVLIGTNDLLADMGLPGEYEHERVRAAYACTSAACSSRWRRKCRGSCITLQPASAAFSIWRARCSSCRRVWTSCTCRFGAAGRRWWMSSRATRKSPSARSSSFCRRSAPAG